MVGIAPARIQDGRVPLRMRVREAAESTNAKNEFLETVWPQLKPDYDRMRETVERFCRARLEQHRIRCEIASRTKTTESIEASLTRRADQLREQVPHHGAIGAVFHTMHDLVGLRIVLDFPDDLETVRQFINDTFQQEKEPAVFEADRAVGSWKTWFGAYQSTNYRVSVKTTEDDKTLVPYQGVMFEVQLTTLPESLYNKFAHPLLYKNYAGPLTKQDQPVIDLGHGLSLCWGLVTMYLQENLKTAHWRRGRKRKRSEDADDDDNGTADPDPEAEEAVAVAEMVANGRRLDKSLRTAVAGPDHRATFSLPDDVRTLHDLQGWVDGHAKDAMQTLQSIGEAHLKIAGETRDLNREILEAQREMARLAQSQEEDECLQAFRAVDGGTKYEWYKDRVERRVPGTCEWFVGHDHFRQWLARDSGLLLVTADPGCGKSVLAKYLVEERLPIAAADAAVCYFFCKDQLQDTINQALCAVLHQLLCQRRPLLRHAMAEYKKHGENLCSVTKALWTILEGAGNDPDAGPVIIVLDALDEYREGDFLDLIYGLTRLFGGGAGDAGDAGDASFGLVKVLLTSRPYEQVISRFNAFSHLRILGEDECDGISKEVDCVIEDRVKRLATKTKLRADLADHLTRALKKTQHRTYLWVYLAFELLESQPFRKTKKGIDALLVSFPTTSYAAYEKILSRSHEHSTVRKVLSIILAAKRPLSLEEMNVAVHTDTTSTSLRDLDLEELADFKVRLRSLCGLFVSVYKGRVHFLHQTAREFLLKDMTLPLSIPMTMTVDPQPKWQHSITTQDAHGMLAEACVGCLGFSDLSPYADIHDTPFLHYAATFWCIHVREASIDARILSSILHICDTRSRSHLAWTRIFWKKDTLRRPPTQYTDLCMAAATGIKAVVESLLNTGVSSVKEVDEYGQTPLFYATRYGNRGVAKLLLDAGADIDAVDRHGRTPLFDAVLYDNEGMLQLLLKAGANIEAVDRAGRTPLFEAVDYSKEGMVKFLLGAGVNIEAVNEREGRFPTLFVIPRMA